MKRLELSVLFIFISLSLLAQKVEISNVLNKTLIGVPQKCYAYGWYDSISWNSTYAAWVIGDTLNYMYDINGNKTKEETTSKYSGKTEYVYDAKGLVIEEKSISNNPIDSNYFFSYDNFYSYDIYGNLIEQNNYDKYRNNILTYQTKNNYTYNSSNQPTYKLIKKYQYNCCPDIGEHMDSTLKWTISNENEIYTWYDWIGFGNINNKPKTIITKYVDGTYESKVSFEYDIHGNEIERKTEKFVDSNWQINTSWQPDNYRHLLTYDGNNIVEDILQYWHSDIGNFKNEMRKVYTDFITVNVCIKEENNFNTILKIYPNPTNDYINIQSENSNSNLNYFITDITGRQMLKDETDSHNTLKDISFLNPGIYFLTIPELGINSIKIIKK